MAEVQGPDHERAIPSELPVLVTGISGTIASHIAEQFLLYGYKVRGLVRKPEQVEWVKEIFKCMKIASKSVSSRI